jgi:hypothetical protein
MIKDSMELRLIGYQVKNPLKLSLIGLWVIIKDTLELFLVGFWVMIKDPFKLLLGGFLVIN